MRWRRVFHEPLSLPSPHSPGKVGPQWPTTIDLSIVWPAPRSEAASANWAWGRADSRARTTATRSVHNIWSNCMVVLQGLSGEQSKK